MGDKPKYTADSIIEILKGWVSEHGRIPTENEFQKEPNVPSRKAIWELFGGFTNLLRAAGYTPTRKVHQRKDTRSNAQKLSKEDFHRLIHKMTSEIGHPPTHQQFCQYLLRQHGLPIDPRNYLKKSWSKILLDCGLEPPRRGREADEELEKLQQWIDTHGRVPTVSEIDNDPNLPASTYYYDHFGSYEKALAKLSQKPNRKSYWSDQELIQVLRKFARDNDRSPCRDDFSTGVPYYTTFEKRFGSWSNALQAAGLDPNMQVYGYQYRTNHGHIRPSYIEGVCDDLLGRFGIVHEHDVPYRNYVNTERYYTFDTVIQDTWFVEVAGMITERQWMEKAGFRPNSIEAEYCTKLTAKIDLLREKNFHGQLILVFKDNDILEKLRPIVEGAAIVDTSSGKVLARRLFNHSQREEYSDKELLENIRLVAEQLGHQPTLADMLRPDMPYPSIYTKRKNWSEWLDLAGFNYQYRYTDDELMEHLLKLENLLGRLPERKDVTNQKPSDMVYCRRFGSRWSQVMQQYRNWKSRKQA